MVFGPFFRVGLDVGADAQEFPVVADDTIPEPFLPAEFVTGLVRQAHCAVGDLAEGVGAVFDANGDEIMAGVAVIPARQARRFDAVFVFEQGHLPPSVSVRESVTESVLDRHLAAHQTRQQHIPRPPQVRVFCH